jgi:hypothetical protein
MAKPVKAGGAKLQGLKAQAYGSQLSVHLLPPNLPNHGLFGYLNYGRQ